MTPRTVSKRLSTTCLVYIYIYIIANDEAILTHILHSCTFQVLSKSEAKFIGPNTITFKIPFLIEQ